MRVAVTGASGLIGSALVPHLRTRGHDVVRLVRGAAVASDEVQWDPQGGTVDLAGLEAVDAVVHLAGAAVGPESYRSILTGANRWTDSYREKIRSSRVRGTDTLARALAQLDSPPQVLISGSAIGYYGATGDTEVDETAPPGDGFLADVVAEWEKAADPAREAGIRVAHPRTGLVVAGQGGAWKIMWPIFRLGLGARLSSGKQWWSFISLRDEVRALEHLLLQSIDGPVNLTAPNPATNEQVTKAMGTLLRRPAVLRVPRVALDLVLDGFATEVVDTPRVAPAVLLGTGFEFSDPTIDEALTWAWASR